MDWGKPSPELHRPQQQVGPFERVFPYSGTGTYVSDRVLDRFTPEERKNIGIHTCPGGDCDSVHSFDVDYHELLPSMFQFVFLLQLTFHIVEEIHGT
jgi:hypothetical protein